MYWDLYYPQPSRGTAVADSVRPREGDLYAGEKAKKGKHTGYISMFSVFLKGILSLSVCDLERPDAKIGH